MGQNQWEEILEFSDKLTVNESNISDVEELARLKKIIKFIDELLITCDPELMYINNWGNFTTPSSNCLSQLKAFEQNKNIGHLQNANANLDTLLSYIRSVTEITGKGAAIAAGKAFKKYTDTIEQHIKKITVTANNSVNEANKLKQEADTACTEINASKVLIKQFEKICLDGTENEKSLQEKMQTVMIDAETRYEKINNFHEILTKGNVNEAAIILQIEEAKNKAIENNKSISNLLEETTNWIDELDKFYSKIYGKENEEGELEGGLKNELEARQKALNKFKETQETTQETLRKQIESLLPGATSAGLASAYRELKESFDKPIKTNTWIFYGSLVLLFVLTLIPNKWVGISNIEINNTITFFNYLLHKLPIALPIIWLAITSSKRRSEAQRLQQEYAHKEAVAKSYESFKRQIQDLNEEDNELMKDLLNTAIKAIAFNASDTLDNKHGDKVPLQELIEKIPLERLLEIFAGEKLKISQLQNKKEPPNE